MTGDLAEFDDALALPPCCRVPRELMRQIEENQTGPSERRKTLASCGRWLAAKGHPVSGSTIRTHLVNNHAGRFDA